MKQYNKRVLERYADAGALELSKSIFSHCIHLDEKEKKLIRQSDVYVVQNTESNFEQQRRGWPITGIWEKMSY